MQLFRLPDELLVMIFSNLPAQSILACGASCSQLYDVIKYSRLLDWKIWVMDRGIQVFQDLPTSGLSIGDLFSSVSKWERDWSNLSIRDEATMLFMSRPCHGIDGFAWQNLTDHELLLRSGYLIHMGTYENPGWSHTQLSRHRGIRRYTTPEWTNVQLGSHSHVKMEGWSLDLDQNLVATLLRFPGRPQKRPEIHLLHFTDGKCHESANIPVVQLEFEGKYNHNFETRIEIMGQYLVVLLAHRTHWRRYQTLYLVDWVKGHVKCRQCFSANTYFPVLTSISEDTFVLGLKRDWALALCRITKKGDALTICRLCKLKLPPIQRNTNIQLKAFNRAPLGTDNPSALTHHSTLPLRSAPSESILSFYVVAQNKDQYAPRSRTLFFYAHPSDLRDLADGAVRAHALAMKHRNEIMLCRPLSHLSPSRPIIMPWDDWGPRTTQWIDGNGALYQSLSGKRCAISMRSGEVQVLDFHRTRVKDRSVETTKEAAVDGTKEAAVGGTKEAAVGGTKEAAVGGTKGEGVFGTKKRAADETKGGPWTRLTGRTKRLWMKLTKRLRRKSQRGDRGLDQIGPVDWTNGEDEDSVVGTDEATVVGTDEDSMAGTDEETVVGIDQETKHGTDGEAVHGAKGEETTQIPIVVKGCFKHGIISKLPYDMIEKSRGAKGQLLIDDQWIVQTQYEDGNYAIWVHSLNENGL